MSRRRATDRARQLLQDWRCQSRIPVDVFSIARELGIEVVERPLGDVSALLLRRDGRAICVVNEEHHPVRKRFSVAHEVGHFLLHPPKEAYDVDVAARDDRSSKGVHREEIEANAFAAELLMPEERVRDQMYYPLDLFVDDDQVRDLAKKFGVSQAAMTHRLTSLGLLHPED